MRSEVGQALEPKGKLDTMITTVTGGAVRARRGGGVGVNGPEDGIIDRLLIAC